MWEESVQDGSKEEGIWGNGQGGSQESKLEPFTSPQGSSSLLPEEEQGWQMTSIIGKYLKSRVKVVLLEILQQGICRNFFNTSEPDNCNRPFPHYASMPANNGFKSRLGWTICFEIHTFTVFLSTPASTSNHCSKSLEQIRERSIAWGRGKRCH